MDSCPGETLGGRCPTGNCLGGNCPRGSCPGGQLSQGSCHGGNYLTVNKLQHNINITLHLRLCIAYCSLRTHNQRAIYHHQENMLRILRCFPHVNLINFLICQCHSINLAVAKSSYLLRTPILDMSNNNQNNAMAA
jgi:hypothetical protein